MKSNILTSFAKVALIVALLICILFFAWKSSPAHENEKRTAAVDSFCVIVSQVHSQGMTLTQERELAFFTFSGVIATILSFLATIAVEFSNQKHWGCNYYVKTCIFRALLFVIICGFLLGLIALSLIFNRNSLPSPVFIVNIVWHALLFVFCTKLILVYCTSKAAAYIIYYWATLKITLDPHQPTFECSLDNSIDDLSDADRIVLRIIARPRAFFKQVFPRFRYEYDMQYSTNATEAIIKSTIAVDDHNSALGLSLMREIVSEIACNYSSIVAQSVSQRGTIPDLNNDESLRKENERVFIFGSLLAKGLIGLYTQKQPQHSSREMDYFEQIGRINWHCTENDNMSSILYHYYFYAGMCVELMISASSNIDENNRNQISEATERVISMSNLYGRVDEFDCTSSALLKLLFSVICLLVEGDSSMSGLENFLLPLAKTNDSEFTRLLYLTKTSGFTPGISPFVIEKVMKLFKKDGEIRKSEMQELITAATNLGDTTNTRALRLRRILNSETAY